MRRLFAPGICRSRWTRSPSGRRRGALSGGRLDSTPHEQAVRGTPQKPGVLERFQDEACSVAFQSGEARCVYERHLRRRSFEKHTFQSLNSIDDTWRGLVHRRLSFQGASPGQATDVPTDERRIRPIFLRRTETLTYAVEDRYCLLVTPPLSSRSYTQLLCSTAWRSG